MIEDTLLVNSSQAYPDSDIRVNCVPHNAPAAFYSKETNTYKCFKCLVHEQDLVFIDKRFKKEMEDFESIKEMTLEVIESNLSNINLMKDWKKSIRSSLIKVKEHFIEWIDNFTNKFFSSLKKIESSRELVEFAGEDKRLSL